MSKEREALDLEIAHLLKGEYGYFDHVAGQKIADAVDTYDKAERLEEHGLTCTKASPSYREDGVLIKTEDGEKWYCYCERGKELSV